MKHKLSFTTKFATNEKQLNLQEIKNFLSYNHGYTHYPYKMLHTRRSTENFTVYPLKASLNLIKDFLHETIKK